MPCSDCSPAFTALIKLKECKLLSTTRCNVAPCASERTELNELVAHAEKEFVKYRETIARLQDTIVALENEKENLKEQVRLAKSLMAPIRKLPPEILGQIFMDHGVTNILDFRIGEAYIPGFKIASICSHWRSIAVGTPGLWCDIGLLLDRGSTQEPFVTLVEHLLKLSAKFKLNFQINAGEDAPVPACLPLLCDQANRWQSMSGWLLGRNGSLLEALSSIQRRLDSLKICSVVAPFDYYSAWVEGAQKLRTATVFNIEPSSAAIPWNQIVDLTLEESYPPSIAKSLTNLPNLRSLKVDCLRVLGGEEHYVLQQVHSNLCYLTIVVNNSNNEIHMSKLLGALVLPKLQSLSIVAKLHKTNQNALHWSSVELPSLLSRSSALITSFCLDGPWVASSDLIALLRIMPALTTLYLSELYDFSQCPDNMVNDELLSSLHYHQGRQPILTHLTSLTLKGCQLASSMAFMHLFVKVVHSRWKPSSFEDEVACIKTVKLEAVDVSIPRNAVQTLMMLRTRGLDVSVEDEYGNSRSHGRRF